LKSKWGKLKGLHEMLNRIVTHLGQPFGVKPDGSIPKMKPIFHKGQLSLLLKAIWQTPMDMELKMVLTMRVWGVNPNVFNPLTQKEVAQFCRKHRDDTIFEYNVDDLASYEVDESDIQMIKEVEKVARATVQEYLSHVSNQEIIDRYNKDFNKNHLNVIRHLGKPLK
jgi:hypothetical protein